MTADYSIFERFASAKSAAFLEPRVRNQPFFHGNTHGFRIAIRQGMKPDDLKRRTKAFATEIVKFARKLPLDVASSEISRQMIKSGTAVAATYRSSCRAKSKADFISKMTTVEEEADETLRWLELLVSTETVTAAAAAALIDEADQIVRIIVTSINTARGGSR
jgi:four helix bundle protein